MPLLDPTTDEHDWLKSASDAFTGRAEPNLDVLWQDEEDDEAPSFWEDSEWFVGGEPQVDQQPFRVQQETQEHATEQGVDPWAQAEVREQNTFTTKRWFAKFDNGEIPENALQPIGGGHALRPDAAVAFKAMRRAAKRKGITIGITDSYRTYDEQVDLKARKPTLAATPGKSNHGWGIATDLALSEDAYRWMRRNGSKYGFSQPMSYEPWHWEYGGGYKGARKSVQKSVQNTIADKPAREVGASDLSMKATPFGSGVPFRDAVLAFATDPIEYRQGLLRKRGTTRMAIDKDPETPQEIKALAKQMAKAYGWTGKQWDALVELWTRESGWNPEAENEETGAAGIPQRNPSEDAHPWASPREQRRFMNDVIVQLRWGLSYIEGRHGSPLAALRYHDANNSY